MTVTLPRSVSPFVALFSESTARALVTVPRGHDTAFTALCDEHNVPWSVLGTVTSAPDLVVRDVFSVPLDEIRSAWSETLPKYFGGVATKVAVPVLPETD